MCQAQCWDLELLLSTGPSCNPLWKDRCDPTGQHLPKFSQIRILICIWLFCCSSVTQSRPALCNPMDCSTPGFPVLHCLPELARTHVHWVSDAIQPPRRVTPFSTCPQSFPASGSFPVSWLFSTFIYLAGLGFSQSTQDLLSSYVVCKGL